MGRSLGNRDLLARRCSANGSAQARFLYRPRSKPSADGILGDAVRHAQFRRAWRILLGEHGCGRALHFRRRLLGIRRPGLEPDQVFHAVRRRRGPCFKSDKDRHRQIEKPGRKGRLRKPCENRLQCRRRRMGGGQAWNRRAVRRRSHPRAPQNPQNRFGLSSPLYECSVAGDRRSGHGASRLVRAGRRRRAACLCTG